MLKFYPLFDGLQQWKVLQILYSKHKLIEQIEWTEAGLAPASTKYKSTNALTHSFCILLIVSKF